jgi:hypothetical protein
MTRRVLVVISDGDDNLSHLTRAEAISDAIGSGTVLFAISIQSSGSAGRGQNILKNLSGATGGGLLTGLNRSEAPKLLDALGQAIDNLYYVRYSPPPGSKVHEVDIKPAEKQKLTLSYPEKYLWMQ